MRQDIGSRVLPSHSNRVPAGLIFSISFRVKNKVNGLTVYGIEESINGQEGRRQLTSTMADKRKLVSKAEFARLMGVSKPYITKLVQQGKLKTVNGKLNFEESKKRLRGNRDPGRDHLSKTAKNGDQEEERTEQDSMASGYTRARTANELIKAERANLELKRLKKELVPAGDVSAAMFNIGRVVRDGVLNIPDRVSPLLVGLDSQEQIRQILEKECKTILVSLYDKIDGLKNEPGAGSEL